MAGGFHHYDPGHLEPIGGSDINLSSPTPRWKPGQLTILNDRLGARYMKYCKNISGGAYAQGELVAKAGTVGNANGQVVAAAVVSGTTTSLITSAQVASMHEGAIVYVASKNTPAGGAPAGEIAWAKNNTATAVNLDKTYPLSGALAVSDTVTFQATYCSFKAASATNAGAVLGVVLPLSGVSDGEYFWAQQKGRCRVVTMGAAIAVGLQAIVGATAGTATLALLATSTQMLKIGHFYLPVLANFVNRYGWLDIRVDEYVESNSAIVLTA